MLRSFLTLLIAFALFASVAPNSWAFEKKQHAPVSDDAIHDHVRRKLADDAVVKGAALEVDVQNGVVTLKGRVAGKKAKEKAGKLAKKVSGVTSVNNELVISSEANPQD
jgi:osmotically-inducible protein OsmY